MQNTPQAFRGAAAPGVNFSDHSFDNHVGTHCQPSGYQPYTNPPYHPVPSPRPHHYANHQMQQNMAYRHHGGAYAPNQNQYGQNMNQDVYRNHHSGYGGANVRNMPSKQWPDNNSSDMMPPYGQVSHPSMMNNQQQMPMRSPPHATSNMNPVPPQGQQHYRQMQSPAHSPHSWSQGQIPSPGVMHSSRTTPSPLSAHVRSPGHSQPFSPPATMNLPPHPPPPENGQLPQPISQSGGNDPANPLHSLQKMVMLESDSRAMLPMMGDGNEPFQNQCDPNNYSGEGISNETKDSSYSTYYNMDENRFESKRNIASSDPSLFTEVQQVSNCNYPMQSHPVGCEEIKNPAPMPNANVSKVQETLQSPLPIPNSSASQTQCNTNVNQSEVSLSAGECPPHAESAPVFTDQTKAAVSTNSEQALESKSNWVPTDLVESPSDLQKSISPDEFTPPPTSYTSSNSPETSIKSETHSDDHVTKSENTSTLNSNCTETQVTNISPAHKSPLSDSSDSNSSCSIQNNEEKDCKQDSECLDTDSCTKPLSDLKEEDLEHNPSPNDENCHNTNLQLDCKTETIKELLSDSQDIDEDVIKSESEVSLINQSATNSYSSSTEDLNSVKVVIHRIRRCESDNTWHVPDQEKISKKVGDEKKSESKVPNVGPQIVILSPDSSPQKQFGFHSTVESNSVITVKEESNDVEIIGTIASNSPSKKISGSKSSFTSPDKRRGRPVGSKTKSKPSTSSKKKKNSKGGKKKKQELAKSKPTDMPPKPKKSKAFNGPYVHIIGNKDNPSSISVINVAQKEEEKVSKILPKRSFNSNSTKKKQIGHMSTLSPTYDAFNRDKTWLCVFCHKGSHMSGLGDLYGPYYIKGKTPEKPASSSSRAKRRKSDNEDNRASKRSRQASGHTNIETTPLSKKPTTTEGEDTDLREVWIHEDCAIWCQSVSLMAEEVHGLEEAVSEASEHVCCQCKYAGATLGCWSKGCKEQYHFCCAKHIGCQMDIENFSLLCPKHQKKSSPM